MRPAEHIQAGAEVRLVPKSGLTRSRPRAIDTHAGVGYPKGVAKPRQAVLSAVWIVIPRNIDIAS